MMVREPVERAYSAHRHELARGFETEEFEAALDLEEQRLAGEVERMRRRPDLRELRPPPPRLPDPQPLQRADRAVPSTSSAPTGSTSSTPTGSSRTPPGSSSCCAPGSAFRAWTPENVEAWNARPRLPMSDDLRARLDRHFEPYDARLAELMGRQPSWRVPVRDE